MSLFRKIGRANERQTKLGASERRTTCVDHSRGHQEPSRGEAQASRRGDQEATCALSKSYKFFFSNFLFLTIEI